MSEQQKAPDLTIFENDTNNHCHNNDYKSCDAILRIKVCMKYYETLQIRKNNENLEIFIKFIDSSYPVDHLLNDYYHLINIHQDQIEDITDSNDNKCNDLKNCSFSQRHHRNNTVSITDKGSSVIIETMDSLHFYMYHLIHSGLRQPKHTQQNMVITDDDETKEDKYFEVDKEFSRFKQRINETNENTSTFQRLNTETTDSGNKFNINLKMEQTPTNVNISKETSHKIKTYLDEIYDTLKRSGIDEACISSLKSLIESQDFESETLTTDIKEFSNKGNIASHIKNNKAIEIISTFTDSNNGLLIIRI